ncbi:MAG: hypothetical protein J4F37_02555 [Acidobacteria bacterium]|nr:hypothetical protein [Acidobacteriota bacterium]MCY4659399.1 hypothetical protein [Acidobacteriota bacterium]
MAACPACDVEIDVDEFDVEQGDELSCTECGANLVVAAVLPVELMLAGEDEEDEDEQEDYDGREVDDAEINGGADERDDDADWEA